MCECACVYIHFSKDPGGGPRGCWEEQEEEEEGGGVTVLNIGVPCRCAHLSPQLACLMLLLVGGGGGGVVGVVSIWRVRDNDQLPVYCCTINRLLTGQSYGAHAHTQLAPHPVRCN